LFPAIAEVAANIAKRHTNLIIFTPNLPPCHHFVAGGGHLFSSARTAWSKYRPHHHEGSIGLLHQFDEPFNR
jgi:hypothetical protein